MDEYATLNDGTVIRLKDAVNKMIREVITALFKAGDGPTRNAMLCLMNHMSANWRAMYILDQHGTDDEKNLLSHSRAILTRSMFDAYLQLAFIAQQDTEARATLYMNFEVVELYEHQKKVVKRDDDLSKDIAASPLRPEGEPKLKARYDAVVAAYTNNKGKVRNQWYPQGNLGQLAEDVGKSDEYFWYVQRFNSSVHAGPLAAMKGNPADDFLGYAATLLSRVANLVTAQHRLKISTGAQSTIDAFAVKSLTSTA